MVQPEKKIIERQAFYVHLDRELEAEIDRRWGEARAAGIRSTKGELVEQALRLGFQEMDKGLAAGG